MMNLVGEFLGTFLLLWVIAKYGTPLTVGAGLALSVYLFGHLSGGHFNPAVSFMKYLAGSMSRNTFLKYAIVQMLAAYVLLMFLKR